MPRLIPLSMFDIVAESVINSPEYILKGEMTFDNLQWLVLSKWWDINGYVVAKGTGNDHMTKVAYAMWQN